MTRETEARWRELCEKAIRERDLPASLTIATEIETILGDEQQRLCWLSAMRSGPKGVWLH